jgi:hypothetical protein
MPIDWSSFLTGAAGAGNSMLFGAPETIARKISGDQAVDQFINKNKNAYEGGRVLGDVASAAIPFGAIGKAGKEIKALAFADKALDAGKGAEALRAAKLLEPAEDVAKVVQKSDRAKKIESLINDMKNEAKTSAPVIAKRDLYYGPHIDDSVKFDEDLVKAKGVDIPVPSPAKNAKITDYFTSEDIDGFNNARKYGEKLRKENPGQSLYGVLANVSPEELEKVNRMGPATQAFFESGFNNNHAPVFNVGWRYGGIPAGGKSINFADNTTERGVSFMQTAGNPKTNTTYEMFNGDPNKVQWFAGMELLHKGSDGEPLMVALEPLKGIGKI